MNKRETDLSWKNKLYEQCFTVLIFLLTNMSMIKNKDPLSTPKDFPSLFFRQQKQVQVRKKGYFPSCLTWLNYDKSNSTVTGIKGVTKGWEWEI